jgi:chitodextrinase
MRKEIIMTRRSVSRILLVVVAAIGLFVLSGVLLAQGNSETAFERVKAVQEKHTERLMALNGVEGTAIGLDRNDRPALKVFTARQGVAGIPKTLDGVAVQVVVTGKFYALVKPDGAPGLDKKNPPPAAPTGLTATPVNSGQINLTWNPNTEDDLDHYNVYRSDTSGGPYTQIAPSIDSPTYSDGGLAAGTTYYYVVTAVDTATKESDYSSEASATTDDGPPDVTPPAAPTGLTATAVSSNQINLGWADNSESDLSHYNVYRSTTTGSYGEPIASNVTTSSYSDSGLAAETTYYYVVTAVDTSGNESANSPEVSATTDPPPEKPPYWCERPVPIGVSTGHPDITAGTIGCRVTDGTNVYALSNNHVYANENLASIGDNVLQPGTYDDGVDPDDAIGTLADFEPIVFHPRKTNTIDAAIALTTTDKLGNATPLNDPYYPDGYGTPSSKTAPADVGLAVQKYGRTTGHTYGEVTGINATVRVSYSTRSAIFVGQILITPGTFSAGGDSGSLIVTDDDGKNPVGLLFAGSSTLTVANPIDAVLEAFGVTIDGE